MKWLISYTNKPLPWQSIPSKIILQIQHIFYWTNASSLSSKCIHRYHIPKVSSRQKLIKYKSMNFIVVATLVTHAGFLTMSIISRTFLPDQLSSSNWLVFHLKLIATQSSNKGRTWEYVASSLTHATNSLKHAIVHMRPTFSQELNKITRQHYDNYNRS